MCEDNLAVFKCFLLRVNIFHSPISLLFTLPAQNVGVGIANHKCVRVIWQLKVLLSALDTGAKKGESWAVTI